MHFLLLSACLTVCAMPLRAEEVLSEVTGNWGGTGNTGFYFRATLDQLPPEQGTGRLRIWHALDSIPVGGTPQFENDEMTLSAYARDSGQRLELFTSANGTILQVVTEFADEAAEGTVTVLIQYVDNQFTVIGFDQQDQGYEGNIAYRCTADLWNGTVTVNGVTSTLPPRDFEALNATDWTYSAAFDRGICPRPE